MFLAWKLFRLHLITPFSLLCNKSFTLALRILPIPDPHVSLKDSSLERFRLVIVTPIAPREGAHVPRLSLFVFMDMRAGVCEQAIQTFHG